MGGEYKPPFTITETITNLMIEIGELVGRITEKESLSVKFFIMSLSLSILLKIGM